MTPNEHHQAAEAALTALDRFLTDPMLSTKPMHIVTSTVSALTTQAQVHAILATVR